MKVCVRCVLDQTDPNITFDDNGVCNHCHRYDEMVDRYVVTGQEGFMKMSTISSDIIKNSINKKYDCVIGLSGGVDSTYALYRAVETFGLNPLVVHLDNGWDSELAVNNITKTVKEFNLDLHTHVIDWEEFKDIQLSFLKAGVPDLEIPTDLAINSILFKVASNMGINCIVWGGNVRTESHLPKAWSQGHRDWKYVQNIHNLYGHVPIKTFPHMTLLEYIYLYKKVKQVYILNFLDYNKQDAMQELKHRLNFFSYDGKHCESIYTRFYQRQMLPLRFFYDKRKSHLSSLICSGYMERDEALKILETPPWIYSQAEEDKNYVAKKFGITVEELERYLYDTPFNNYNHFPNYGKFLESRLGKFIIGLVFRDRMKIL